MDLALVFFAFLSFFLPFFLTFFFVEESHTSFQKLLLNVLLPAFEPCPLVLGIHVPCTESCVSSLLHPSLLLIVCTLCTNLLIYAYRESFRSTVTNCFPFHSGNNHCRGAARQLSYQELGIAKLSGFREWLSNHFIVSESEGAGSLDLCSSHKMIIFAHHLKVLDGVQVSVHVHCYFLLLWIHPLYIGDNDLVRPGLI